MTVALPVAPRPTAWTVVQQATQAALPLTFDPLAQTGIAVLSADGGEPGTATLLLDTPAGYSGDLYRGFTIPARDVQLGVYIAARTQAAFLALKDQFIAAATLGTPVQLIAVRGDGTTRTVTGVVSENTSGTDEDSGGGLWQVFALTVHCSSPFWQGVPQSTSFVVVASKPFFQAPFFPVLLQGASINQAAPVTVVGTQPATPVWTITGPFTGPLELMIPGGGPSLTLNYTASSDEIITIDTTPGVQTVTSTQKPTVDPLTGSPVASSAPAVNLFPYLSSDSQLFGLPVGVSTIQAAVSGATAATIVTLTYTPQWQSL